MTAVHVRTSKPVDGEPEDAGVNDAAVRLTAALADRYRATFEHPTETSAGTPYVLVNGTFVVRDGKLVKGAMPGRAIRSTSTTP